MEKIFFQSSLPRAGSTLLQNIMAQNPNFYCSPTSGLIELLYASRDTFSKENTFIAQDPEIMKKAWLGYCRGALEGYYSEITSKKYIIDKSRGWGVYYQWVNRFYPNPKMVCMVRDPRSIYTSMEKNYRKHPEKDAGVTNWGELKGTTTAKRVDLWAQTAPVGVSMDRLEDIIAQGLDKNILFIKFEDLTLYPQKEISRIYDYFEIEKFEHDFQNVKQLTQEDDKVHGIFGDHKIRSIVKPVPTEYNEILGDKLSNDIASTYPWFYNYFNYNI